MVHDNGARTIIRRVSQKAPGGEPSTRLSVGPDVRRAKAPVVRLVLRS